MGELFAVDTAQVITEQLAPGGLDELFGAKMPTRAQATKLFEHLAAQGYVLATERMEITIREGSGPPPSALYIASRCPCGEDHEPREGFYPCEED